MRIQKLAIHNIASIADAEIDFTKEPLCGSDVFLITGRTGSGKSTILDAICLALYADTPRLSDNEIQGRTGEELLQVDDPVRLLRLGAGSGYVRLEFKGVNACAYEAVWAVRRARNKATGRIQGKEWRLKNLSTGAEYTKDYDIRSEIGIATGLSFGQFCRTTMLAQGQFTRFLNSRDNEKAEILEKITGADIYRRIGVKIFDITKERSAACDVAEARMKEVVTLTEEEREEMIRDAASLGEKSRSASEAAKQCLDKKNWLIREAGLKIALERAAAAAAECEGIVRSEDYLREAALVAAFRSTEEVRRQLAVQVRAERAAEAAQREIAGLAERYRVVLGGIAGLVEEKSRLKAEKDCVDAELDGYAAVLPVLSREQTVMDNLRIVENGRKSLGELELEARNLEAELEGRLWPSLEAVSADAAAAVEKRALAEAALKASEEALAAAAPQSVRDEMSLLQKRKTGLEILGLSLDRLSEAEKERRKEADAIEAEGRNIAAKTAQLEAVEEEVEALRVKATQAMDTYKLHSSVLEDAVKSIRNSLKTGDYCPVCMHRIEKSLPTDNELEIRLKPYRQEAENLSALYAERKEMMLRVGAEVSGATRLLDDRRRAFADDGRVGKLRGQIAAQAGECGLEAADDIASAHNAAYDDVCLRLETLSEREAACRALEKTLADRRAECEAARKAAEDARDRQTRAEGEAKAKASDLEKLNAVIEERRRQVADSVRIVSAILAGTVWENSWQETPESFKEGFAAAVSRYNGLAEKSAALGAGLESLSAKVGEVQDVVGSICGIEPSWTEFHPEDIRIIPDIRSVAELVKDGLLVATHNLGRARGEADDASSEVDAFLSGHSEFDRGSLAELSGHSSEDIEEMERRHKAAETSLASAHAALEVNRRSEAEHLAIRPQLAESDTVESLEKERIASEEAAREAAGKAAVIARDLERDEENRRKIAEMMTEAERLRKEYQGWRALNDLLGDSGGNNFRKIAQSYVLGSLVAAANKYMRDLTGRYTLKVVPGTFIIEVEDAWQGYVSRPASTISGGESFLVSLSLALALSDIGDGLDVGTLFIDEGFGTLSGEPLQNAVDTLRALHSKSGKQVGIISHIEELREKIPVKILVSQDDRTAVSTVSVVSGQG